MLRSTMFRVLAAEANGKIKVKDLGILAEWVFAIVIPKMGVVFPY